ncbi:uncharacterized protein LOC113359635 [Papaver somniferum]|uniref:uncharacterized protein LOC113359635 n=1 Tax=Papaver somniferum TaxID=3469 RepID=UPI000E700EBE|nr:uncharacterized protein LOC113359635 [Papaver somniferum]
MVITNGIHPTHMFFADDVFIFCNGAKKSIENLMKLLESYQLSSGQVINKSKSKLFIDGTTEERKRYIQNLIQMDLSTLPYKYLGVILHSGRVRISTIWPMVELMQKKLAYWKGKLLSFHDRNFLWSGDGDGEIRKYTILSWKKVCTPYSEGGLGIQRLEVLNKALLMKLLWRIMNSDVEWASFIKAKYQDKHGLWKSNWQLSSIWPGLKWAWDHLKENIRWCLGDGRKVSLWFDSWINDTLLIEDIGYTDYVKEHMHMKVADIILDG